MRSGVAVEMLEKEFSLLKKLATNVIHPLALSIRSLTLSALDTSGDRHQRRFAVSMAERDIEFRFHITGSRRQLSKIKQIRIEEV